MRALTGLVFVLVVSGCAQLPFMGQGRNQGSPESFEMMGRVYVQFGPRAFSGSLRWRHDQEADEVWLGAPLGQTAAYIVRDATGATLTAADQRTYHSMSIEALTKDGLGWSLPLADLSYYVLGDAPPAVAAAERDSAGRLTRVERDGWVVRWTPRETASPGPAILRLDLRKDEVEIRLVIDQLQRPD
jgi:outer membrane lipoprotein LolB